MNKTPFWKEIFVKMENEIGFEDTLLGLVLGLMTTTIYWKFCKDKKSK